jgi:MFS family permease
LKKIKDEWAPLSAGFMLTSILGFFVSLWLIMDLSPTWGFTMVFFFVIMFIASMISMTKAEAIPEHMDHLAIHEPHKAYAPFVRKHKLEDSGKIIRWYEPLFVAYLILWIFYVVHYFRGSIDYTNFYLAVLFFTLTIYFAILFVIDVFSRESLPTWEQVIFAVIIMVTAGYGASFFPIAPIGVLMYFGHMKILEWHKSD